MISIALLMTTTVAFAQPTAKSGAFFAYNDTDRVVTIGVGDFFPTTYVINPHSSQLVIVSTDNQAIHIKKVS